MDANLRPMTLGEILDRTAQLYRSNFLLFAGIFIFYAGVSLVFNLAQLGLGRLIETRHLVHLKWLTYATSGVEIILLLLLVGASLAAISRAVASVHLGEPITIRGAYASTLPRLGRYLWLSAITSFLAWWPIFVLYVGMIAAFFRYRGNLATAGNHTAAAASAAQA
jgi:cytochrome c biogenesis protein CcdA